MGWEITQIKKQDGKIIQVKNGMGKHTGYKKWDKKIIQVKNGIGKQTGKKK